MPRSTTATDALDLAAHLDGVSLFLGYLGETPWFTHQREELAKLAGVVAAARDDVQSRHGLDELQVEERQEALMRELGVLGESGCTIDPGYGRDVAQLDEQLRELAENVIGVHWDHEESHYVSEHSGHCYA